METFKIDSDILDKTVKEYAAFLEAVDTAVKNVDLAVNALKTSGWKSPASEAFFDNFDDSWKKNMEDRIKIITHLESCLKTAQEEYLELFIELEKVSRSLSN